MICGNSRFGAAMAAVAMATILAVAPVAEDAASGLRIWKSKAGCPTCHGWSGDGFPSGFHSEGNAPSLRETQKCCGNSSLSFACCAQALRFSM